MPYTGKDKKFEIIINLVKNNSLIIEFYQKEIDEYKEITKLFSIDCPAILYFIKDISLNDNFEESYYFLSQFSD